MFSLQMSPHKDLLLFNLGFSTHHWDKPSEVTSLGGSLIVGLGGLNKYLDYFGGSLL